MAEVRYDIHMRTAPDASLEAAGAQARVPFQVEPHSFGFRPGIDIDKLNHLAELTSSITWRTN